MKDMAGIITFLVEIAFAASLIGFVTIIMLIPTKKVILSGQAGSKMDSPLVPVLIGAGALFAFTMMPLSVLADSMTVTIAGLAGSVILMSAYLVIYLEHRSMKRLLHSSLPVED